MEGPSDVCISPEVPVLPQARRIHILPLKFQAHSLPPTGMMTMVSFFKSLETASVNIPWEQDVSELLLTFHKLPICPSHHSRQAFSWGIYLSFPRPSTALTFLLPPPLTSKDPTLWENHLLVLPCPHNLADHSFHSCPLTPLFGEQWTGSLFIKFPLWTWSDIHHLNPAFIFCLLCLWIDRIRNLLPLVLFTVSSPSLWDIH